MKTLVPAPCWFGWAASLVWPPFCPNLLLLCPPTTWHRVACSNVAGFSKYVLVMASGKNCWLLRLYNLLQFLLLVHPGHLLLYSLVKDGFCACLVVEIICITKDCQHQRHHQPHLLAWKAKRTWNDSGSEHLWPSISWKNDLKKQSQPQRVYSAICWRLFSRYQDRLVSTIITTFCPETREEVYKKRRLHLRQPPHSSRSELKKSFIFERQNVLVLQLYPPYLR